MLSTYITYKSEVYKGEHSGWLNIPHTFTSSDSEHLAAPTRRCFNKPPLPLDAVGVLI